MLHVNPILNVSDIAATIGWFAKLGWTVGFDWRHDPGGHRLAGRIRERHLAAITRSSSAETGKAAVEEDRTPRPSARTGMRHQTRACGCRSSSTTSTPCTADA